MVDVEWLEKKLKQMMQAVEAEKKKVLDAEMHPDIRNYYINLYTGQMTGLHGALDVVRKAKVRESSER